MSEHKEVVLACQGLKKIYRQGSGEGAEVPVLLGVDMEIVAGERVAVVGASGSGKSTLLHLLGGLDAASAGKIQLMGRDLSEISDAERGGNRSRWRGVHPRWRAGTDCSPTIARRRSAARSGAK